MAEAQTATGFLPQITARLKKALGYGDVIFALAIVGILVVLLLPVPSGLLDLLLGISVTFSVLILMTALFIDRPLNFSSFPTILLVSTMLRLSLNIASTRLILSHGHTGPSAAGHVIEAFGGFVMGGSVIIGAIIFAILTIINFVVITKGSGRIAEVSARFSLDAMPGKQMAIDADLSSGLIDEETARKRRKDLEDESTFFGAMDGASKFVRGDAIAGLLITVINLVAGMIIGVVEKDMAFSEAVRTYTILTIGDGLVSQIPALVVSTGAGMLVSKSGVVGSAEKAVFGQISSHPQAMGIVSFLTFLLAMMPVIPAAPFLLLSFVTGTAAWFLWQKRRTKDTVEEPKEKTQEEVAQEEEKSMTDTLHIDSLRLELGYGLLPLINYQKGHKLTDQIKALRKQLARDLGFVMPSVRIQDNMQLPTNTYIIRVKDIECGHADIRPDMLLVMDPKGAAIPIPGEDTTEPAFGLPAKWIAEPMREEALFKNYTVVDPPTVITTHLTEIIKENITELLTFTETQKLLDDMGPDHKKLVSDLVPSQISVTGVQRILQSLLSEMVSIRDLPTILEAISEHAKTTPSMTWLTEQVRARLARQISFSHANAEGFVPVIVLSPHWEQAFSESLVGQGEEKQLSMAPSKLQEFITNIHKLFEEQAMKGYIPVLLVSPMIRPYVRSIIERFRPSTTVLSQREIHPKARIKTLGQL